MHLYRCDLILHDYLFFATTERGKVAETGPFIHNYALTYALGWARSSWRNEVQAPHYPEELAAAWRREKAYVTPAALLRGGTIISQYNTMPESYDLGKGQSIGYPDWGFAKCWRPASHLRFYVLSRERNDFPLYVRLGKFTAKASLQVEHARQLDRATGECVSDMLLAWDDLSVKPYIFDLRVDALPTRLINHAHFTNVPFLKARFPDGEIAIPLTTGYLSTPDKETEKLFKKRCHRCKEALEFLGTALCTSL
jgi:CRISPR-associated protein Csc1